MPQEIWQSPDNGGRREGEDDALLTERYNYASFVPEKFGPWMRFEHSPPLLSAVPDYPLQKLGQDEATRLPQLCRQHVLTVLEFGSFS